MASVLRMQMHSWPCDSTRERYNSDKFFPKRRLRLKSGGFTSIRPMLIFISVIAGIFALTLCRLKPGAFITPRHRLLERKIPTRKAEFQAGQKLYAQNCAACHGPTPGNRQHCRARHRPDAGSKPGEIFWYITRGDEANGMPSWASLSERQRWQIVTYMRVLVRLRPRRASAAASTPVATGARKSRTHRRPIRPSPTFASRNPGTSAQITVAGSSRSICHRIRPAMARASFLVPPIVWPQAPAGFKVELYATGLENPRLIRTAPNGDFFVAESDKGRDQVFRGITPDGKPQNVSIFATGLDNPFGIAFYPLGPNPKWVYIGNTNSVVRFPYENGDLKARGPSSIWPTSPASFRTTSPATFSSRLDGKTMFVSVGSGSNVDDPDTHPDERHRAKHLRLQSRRLRHARLRHRNSQPGRAGRQPADRRAVVSRSMSATRSATIWFPTTSPMSQPGGFYGWPWWYIGPHQDPRHQGKHPELKDKVIVPDVLLQPHNASLEMTFYEGKQFPRGISRRHLRRRARLLEPGDSHRL